MRPKQKVLVINELHKQFHIHIHIQSNTGITHCLLGTYGS